MKKAIACVGDNCVDYYDNTGETFFGGNPVNVAVYTRRLGGAASYLGAVGDDPYGAALVEALAGKGVDVSHVQVLPGATALSHVRREGGERVFGEYDEGVMARFALRPEDLPFMAGHALAVSGLWGHMEGSLGTLRAMGLPVAFDCADRPEDPVAQTALPQVDLAFFSDDASSEAALEDRLRAVAALGPGLVTATRGDKGSLAYDGRRFYRWGIVPCPVVDTMGAGDSYIAGFLAAWLEKKPVPDCMAAGAACSAVTLGYGGAW